MKEIYLKKNNVIDIVSTHVMLIYIYLRLHMIQGKDIYYLSLRQMTDELFHKSIKSDNKDDLRLALKYFCKEYEVKAENKGKDQWLLDLSELFVDTQKMEFTIIYWEDIEKILNLDCKIDKKINLIYYYVKLISTTYKRVGHLSLSELSELTGFDERTLNRYNKDLTGLGIIYKHDMRAAQCGDGKFKSLTNYYGLYQFKDKIIESANEALAKVKHVKTRPNANKIRSIKQRMKHGTSYDNLPEEDKSIIEEENAHKDEVISHLKDELVKKKMENAKVTIPAEIVEITQNIKKKDEEKIMEYKCTSTGRLIDSSLAMEIQRDSEKGMSPTEIADFFCRFYGNKVTGQYMFTAEEIEEVLSWQKTAS